MSNITTTPNPTRRRPWTNSPAREDDSGIPLAPREGWLTLIALIVLIGAVAVAIDDAAWAGLAPGAKDTQTKFLPVAALLSVLLGAWLAKRPWRPMVAHLISALAGAAFLLYAIAGTLSRAPSLEARLHDLNVSVSTFVNQVFVLDSRSTETSVFLLIMGALVWGAGHFAAFNVFRRHRAGPGIVLAGLMILINVSITMHEEYPHLVVFVLAALLILMRLNLFEQAIEWKSRGMREIGDISSSFVRNGAVMVALTIGASIVLAANASSAPLSRAWNNVDDQLLEIGYDVNRWLGGVTGPARGPNVLFTPSQTIRDFWQSSTEEVFTANVSDGIGRRWRGATYDSFDGRTWQQLDRQAVVVDAGKQLFAGTVEPNTTGVGWSNVNVTVTPEDFGGDVFVAPAGPMSLDQPTELLTNGADGPFAAAKLSFGLQGGVPYTAQVGVRSQSGPLALTASQLAGDGTKYAPWVSRYLEIRPGSVGDDVAQTAQSILASLPQNKRDPYHIAAAVQDYLYQGGGFQYETDVRGLCNGQQVVDCFLQIKKGYCEYFATTMVMLLRELGVPARYVVGYLPGLQQDDGTWLVQRSASHAWVEVYFPNDGWLEFDPTPGNQGNGQSPTHLAEGVPVPIGSQAPGSPPPQDNTDCTEIYSRSCNNPIGADAGTILPPRSGPDLTLPLALAALLLLAAGFLLFALIRRVPSTEPELAFNSISRLAARLGYGPRPSQTTYEYADRLGELVPVASADLHLIATAKVESTYGRRRPGESTLVSIADAYRRARLGLLRLLVRRPRFGRGPKTG